MLELYHVCNTHECAMNINYTYTLLDKVGAGIGRLAEVQASSYVKKFHKRPYMVMKRRCLE